MAGGKVPSSICHTIDNDNTRDVCLKRNMSNWSAEVVEEARGRLLADCQRMRELLGGLLDSHGRIADEVHAIRKLGKSLRGGFCLFRLEGPAAREIQAIGRLLSGPRDAVSRQSTWRKLDWNADEAAASAISGLLEVYVQSAARRPPQAAVDWCLTRVDEARSALEMIPPDDLPARMEEGIRKLRKKLRRRSKRLDHRAEEDFHEARKAVKAWLGAMVLLPEGLMDAPPHCQELAEILGDENDLATLSAWLEAHGFTDHFTPDLWHRIATRRLDLQKRAVQMAETLG
jgi:hypothetical protein